MQFFGSRNSIILFTVVTALIHLGLGVAFFSDVLGKLFLLNAIGYLVLMYALLWKPGFLQGQASLVRWAYIVYTIVTIVAFFVVQGANAFTSVPGLVTKLDELLLTYSLFRYSA